jgi:carboxylate-amine ligase
MFPRCGIPDAHAGWDDYERYVRFLYDTGSITKHTQIWWSVRPHLAFPTVEIRICDGQPQLGESLALAALLHSLTVRIARALDEGEPLPSCPPALIEENFWRAIRYGLPGELIDLRAYPSVRVRPARAALEELVEWVLPAAEEVGAASYLAVPGANAAERQIARHEAGGTLREVYAAEVLEPARV